MTVGELIKRLKKYPENMSVHFDFDEGNTELQSMTIVGSGRKNDAERLWIGPYRQGEEL